MQESFSNNAKYRLDNSCPTLRRLWARLGTNYTFVRVSPFLMDIESYCPSSFLPRYLHHLSPSHTLIFYDSSRFVNNSFTLGMWFEHPLSSNQTEVSTTLITQNAMNKLLTSFSSITKFSLVCILVLKLVIILYMGQFFTNIALHVTFVGPLITELLPLINSSLSLSLCYNVYL